MSTTQKAARASLLAALTIAAASCGTPDGETSAVKGDDPSQIVHRQSVDTANTRINVVETVKAPADVLGNIVTESFLEKHHVLSLNVINEVDVALRIEDNRATVINVNLDVAVQKGYLPLTEEMKGYLPILNVLDSAVSTMNENGYLFLFINREKTGFEQTWSVDGNMLVRVTRAPLNELKQTDQYFFIRNRANVGGEAGLKVGRVDPENLQVPPGSDQELEAYANFFEVAGGPGLIRLDMSRYMSMYGVDQAKYPEAYYPSLYRRLAQLNAEPERMNKEIWDGFAYQLQRARRELMNRGLIEETSPVLKPELYYSRLHYSKLPRTALTPTHLYGTDEYLAHEWRVYPPSLRNIPNLQLPHPANAWDVKKKHLEELNTLQTEAREHNESAYQAYRNNLAASGLPQPGIDHYLQKHPLAVEWEWLQPADLGVRLKNGSYEALIAAGIQLPSYQKLRLVSGRYWPDAMYANPENREINEHNRAEYRRFRNEVNDHPDLSFSAYTDFVFDPTAEAMVYGRGMFIYSHRTSPYPVYYAWSPWHHR